MAKILDRVTVVPVPTLVVLMSVIPPLAGAAHFRPVVSAESATNFGTISEDCSKGQGLSDHRWLDQVL